MITGLYAGLLGIIYVVLTFNVIAHRFKFGVGVGDGNNDTLTRAIRVHANFAEFVPFILILMAICEINGLSELYLHILGGSLVILRVLHAIGLTRSAGTSFERFTGTVGTILILLATAIIAVISYL